MESRRTILAIDDTPANLQVLFDLLSQEGYTVLIAQNGVRGIERANMAQPDLILLDIRMPELDGIETCRRLKQDPITRSIPVIFMTAVSDAKNKVRGFEAGAVDYIPKPFDSEEVLVRIRTHLDLNHLRAQLARQNDELRDALERERELIDLKNRFFSMATHEFRSPLMTILLANGMLKRYGGEMTDEVRLEECSTIDEMVRQMNDTITEVLQFVREQEKTDEYRIEPVYLRAEFERILEPFSDTTSNGRVHLSYGGPIGPIGIDVIRLQQIVSNLVANSLKFSPGRTPVEVKVQGDGEQVAFSVVDQGIGIPEADIPKLFEPFHRAANARGVVGSGLGLSIVKQLVERIGGTIDFSSVVGQGTTFTVAIPTANAGAAGVEGTV